MHERSTDGVSNPTTRDAAGPVRNLLIVHTPIAQDISDWVEVKRRIEARASDIEVRIGNNEAANSVTRRWQVSRPSLVFSPIPLLVYRPRGGTVYAGRALSKLEQTERLARHGLPVPLTSKLTPDSALDPAQWGRYVVMKPFHGRQGEGICLVRTQDVAARYAELTQNGTRDMLVQTYVEHAESGYPTSYRVMTVFGNVIYSSRNSWAMPRTASLEEIARDPKGIIASNTKDFGGTARKIWNDPEIISLGEKAHAAFPEIPVLGVDVVREAGSKRLFIMEVNPKGDTWHLSSLLSKSLTEQQRRDRYEQFGALDVAARSLIEKTRADAS
jgi:ATP-grasp domain